MSFYKIIKILKLLNLMPNKIPYSTKSIISTDIEAVVSILKSGFLSQGPTTLKFKKKCLD